MQLVLDSISSPHRLSNNLQSKIVNLVTMQKLFPLVLSFSALESTEHPDYIDP